MPLEATNQIQRRLGLLPSLAFKVVRHSAGTALLPRPDAETREAETARVYEDCAASPPHNHDVHAEHARAADQS